MSSKSESKKESGDLLKYSEKFIDVALAWRAGAIANGHVSGPVTGIDEVEDIAHNEDSGDKKSRGAGQQG
jgi:hypothetical protein